MNSSDTHTERHAHCIHTLQSKISIRSFIGMFNDIKFLPHIVLVKPFQVTF